MYFHGFFSISASVRGGPSVVVTLRIEVESLLVDGGELGAVDSIGDSSTFVVGVLIDIF